MPVHTFSDSIPLSHVAKTTSVWLRRSPGNVTEKAFSAVRLPAAPLTLWCGFCPLEDQRKTSLYYL